MHRSIFLSLSILVLTPALAGADSHADLAAGEKVFKKCQACHAVGPDAKAKVGPVLNGIVDGAIASSADFKYSDALKALGEEGKVWSAEELDAFLTKPREYAKGTKMSFAGLRKDEDRANLIAYLATFPAGGS